MSVVGFDIGNLNCYIAIAKQGGIEVIANDYSLHATPACVAFGSKGRSFGSSAATSMLWCSSSNTVGNFKHLIGRKFSDPVSQQFIPFVPCEVVQLPNDEIGFKASFTHVTYLDKSEVFTPEQVLAALFAKLKTAIETGMPEIKKVEQCVVAVPYFFTDTQRRAVQSAAKAAKLDPLRVVNETTAIALAYGIYKQDLPDELSEARRVLFLDVGHSCTQASVAAFNKGKLTMLGASHDLSCGGMWLDDCIRENYRKFFFGAPGIDVKKTPKSWLRLLDESEKQKKHMSCSDELIDLDIEWVLRPGKFSASMDREMFEDLGAPYWDKLRTLLVNVLAETKLDAGKIDDVELVGGSSRIPMIKQIVKEMFGKDPKTTMNQDEAVARGAAMQCAILSPAFRARDFAVKDQQPYGIKLTWAAESGEQGESEVFAEGDEFPFSKMLTLNGTGAFSLAAGYAAPAKVPHTTQAIGLWQITGVQPAADGGPREVKVKVRVSPNGTFSVCAATMYEVQTVEIKQEKMEAAPAPAADGAAPADLAPAAAPAAGEKPKTTTKTVAIQLHILETLPFVVDTPRLAAAEEKMQAADMSACAAKVKEELELLLDDMWDVLAGQLGEFVTKESRKELEEKIANLMDCMVEEGDNCEMEVYEKYLAELQELILSVETEALDRFDTTLLRARKAYDEYVAGTVNHAHLDAQDMKQVITTIEEKQRWLDEARHKQETRPKTEPQTVFVREVIGQHTQFENVVNPILNRPKEYISFEEQPKTASPADAKAAPASSH